MAFDWLGDEVIQREITTWLRVHKPAMGFTTQSLPPAETHTGHHVKCQLFLSDLTKSEENLSKHFSKTLHRPV
jgi:hypothetical protein